MTALRYPFLLAFVVLALSACKKNETRKIADLTFSVDTFYLWEGREFLVYVEQGKREYELELGDEAVVKTHVEGSAGLAGGIFLSGLKKGSTELMVTDKVTGQQVVLDIHVVDPYMIFELSMAYPEFRVPQEMLWPIREAIGNEAMTGSSLDHSQILLLHGNADQQFLIFANRADFLAGKVMKAGRYDLSLGGGSGHRLVLHYAEEEEVDDFELISPSLAGNAVLSAVSGVPASGNDTRKISLVKSMLSSNPDIHADQPVDRYQYFILKKDKTAEFKNKYPDLLRLWLSHQARWWDDFQYYGEIADGILK